MKDVVRIEFVGEGFGEILRSDGTRDLVQSVTDEIGANANANNSRGGTGFRTSVEQSGRFKNRRWIGFVSTTDKNSVIAETEDGALSRAIQ
jgi:hypothetical protein